MLAPPRLAAAYLTAAVVFSSVSITFEWLSPIDTPEGPWDWYREVGVRDGILVVAGHTAPGGGLIVDAHWPRFMPVPVYSGAGPESGGLYVSCGFALSCIAFGHFLFRSRQDSARRPETKGT